MVTDDIESRWEKFVNIALLSMKRCQRREIDHHQALSALDGFFDLNTTVVEFVCDSISEQYGNPVTFSSLLELLAQNPSPEDIKALMNRAL